MCLRIRLAQVELILGKWVYDVIWWSWNETNVKSWRPYSTDTWIIFSTPTPILTNSILNCHWLDSLNLRKVQCQDRQIIIDLCPKNPPHCAYILDSNPLILVTILWSYLCANLLVSLSETLVTNAGTFTERKCPRYPEQVFCAFLNFCL